MKLGELLKVIPDDTTVCIEQNCDNKIFFLNEKSVLEPKDWCSDWTVVKMYPERYPAVSSSGITISITTEES